MADEKKKPVNPMKDWVKPAKDKVEALLLKNLEGYARKGATKNLGFYPTGHFNLDFAITQGTLPIKCDLSTLEDFNPAEPGGTPKGRVIEIFGEPGGGKSSTCLRIVGGAQKRGDICLWVDKENSFVDSLAKINGVDIDALYKLDEASLSAEEVFDKLYAAMQSGVDLIVVDSVPALVPQAILTQEDSSKDTVALLARVMSKCIPKLTSIAAKTGCTVIFVNQVRIKPGVMYGPAETTPGGETLKFFASLRLQINKRYAKDAEVWREDENGILQLVAQESLAFIRKTRYSKGLREGIPINIYFEPYFPNPEQVAFDLGRQTQTIRVLNGVFSWKAGGGKKVSGEGRKAFIDAVLAGGHLPDLIADLKVEAADKGIVLPPEITNFKIVSKSDLIVKEAVETDEARATREALEADALRPQENPSLTGVSGGHDEAPVLKRGKKVARRPSAENSLD
jgi:RecA/RadA recombinase